MKKLFAAIFVLLVLGLGYDSKGQSKPAQPTAQKTATTARTAPVKVGEMAPDFTLEDQQGRKVTLSAAKGQAAVVLVFYRGYW